MTKRWSVIAVTGGLLLGACSSDATPAATTPTVANSAGGAPPTAADATVPVTVPIEPTAIDTITTEPTAPATAASPPPALQPSSVAFTSVGQVPTVLDVAVRVNDPALYAVSQGGTIVALTPESSDTVLTLPEGSLVSGGEQGLLGLAFSPDGAHAYINYTDARGATQIDEYAIGDDGVFDLASKRAILTIDQPYPNHNGGSVRYGPDGFLYIGTGDGGAAGDPERRGLDTTELLGKMLRIDPANPTADLPYGIPADNPFVGVARARPEIWAIGLRNPWRFNFDRTTGDLWIADVGQNAWEEIDVAWAADGGGRGANFGWSAFEGTHAFNDDQPTEGVTMPIHEYEHGDLGCSISGGVRYRGTAIPALVGWYVYADFCSGQVRALRINDDGTAGEEITFATNVPSVSSIGEDQNGELYATSLASGEVLVITAA